MPPFGKPFHYTDDLKLASEKRPWYRRWLPKKKKAVAWMVVDDDPYEERPASEFTKDLLGQPVSAWMLTDQSGEVRVSPIEPQGPLIRLDDQEAVDNFIISQED